MIFYFRKLDKSIIVVITDSGIGVSSSSITRIFDKFYQEDTSHSRNGNGLGLTIVKKIIDLHGGTINCNSIQGKGTKFTIILPIKLWYKYKLENNCQTLNNRLAVIFCI